MKENQNKEIELIRKLSQLMTKEKITKLKYENSDLKSLNNMGFLVVKNVIPKNKKVIESYFNYGQKMVASIRKNNIYATQFHPEKSQANGLKILDNFAKWDGSSSV